jgi:hypothetical protein
MRLMIPNTELKTFNSTFRFQPYSHIADCPIKGSTNFLLEKDENWSRMDFGDEPWRGIHFRGMPKA